MKPADTSHPYELMSMPLISSFISFAVSLSRMDAISTHASLFDRFTYGSSLGTLAGAVITAPPQYKLAAVLIRKATAMQRKKIRLGLLVQCIVLVACGIFK